MNTTEAADREFEFTVGDKVRAKVAMWNDLRDDGMGVQHCASRGDILVIRRISPSIVNCLIVSHEDVTDGRGFCAAPNEVERIVNG